jgi:hypothetical protein
MDVPVETKLNLSSQQRWELCQRRLADISVSDAPTSSY